MKTQKGITQPGRILSALALCLFLWEAFFYHLMMEQFQILLQKQSALESIKALAVPGSAFLQGLGSTAVLNGSLFFFLLLGTLFVVFMLFSLLLGSPWQRALFLLAGFFVLVLLTIQDRVRFPFAIVTGLSFASFFVLTLPSRILFSRSETLVLLMLMILISLSLLVGNRHRFFVKARDNILFDTSLGGRMNSFYYRYSPLAASLVSPERGVYEALLYFNEFKDERPLYLADGIFLTGKESALNSADFVISRQGSALAVTNRFGKSTTIEALNAGEVAGSIMRLFSMKGFLRLNTLGLYLFPACLFILVLLAMKCLIANKKAFLIVSTGMAALLVLGILHLSLKGDSLPFRAPPKHLDLKRDGLALAYYLRETKEIPEPFIPSVKEMAESESIALRYWGARLLGPLGDRKEAGKLIALLNDPSPNVRYSAAISLYRLIGRESFPSLIPLLFNDPNWYVRCRVFSVFLEAGIVPLPA